MIELNRSHPANSENRRVQGPWRVTRTQHKPPSPPQQLDGPEHEAREAVGERWKRGQDCPQGVDPEEKLRTCKAKQEVEKEDEIRIIGTNERSNVNESPVHNWGMDTTEYPSSFIPFTEAGSTGEGLEGRSNETLALSLTSVGCAGPTTPATGACTDPETNILNSLNTGNSPWQWERESLNRKAPSPNRPPQTLS